MSAASRARRALGAALDGLPAARAARRVVRGPEVQQLARDEAAVASLEVAVAENTRLAVALEAQVEALETSVVPLLERRGGDVDDHA